MRRRNTLLTKTAINNLVKAKDTETIIKLYEMEQKQNPFNEYVLRENFSSLTYCQKEGLKEVVKSGKTFGLAKDLYFELKELCGFGRITTNGKGEKFFIEYRKHNTDLVYPF